MIYPIKYYSTINFSLITKKAVQISCTEFDVMTPMAFLFCATKWKLCFVRNSFHFIFVDKFGIFSSKRTSVFKSTEIVLNSGEAKEFVTSLDSSWGMHCDVEREVYSINGFRFNARIESPLLFENYIRKWSILKPYDDTHINWIYKLFRLSACEDLVRDYNNVVDNKQNIDNQDIKRLANPEKTTKKC